MKNLKKLSLCLLFGLSLTACGRKDQVLELNEFSNYVTEFEAVSNDVGQPVKVDNLVIKFGDLANSQHRGLCEINGTDTPTVTIDYDAWQSMDEDKRESVVFHELGHCVLRRIHKGGMDTDGDPISMMYPYTLDSSVYVQKEEAYHNELFSERNDF